MTDAIVVLVTVPSRPSGEEIAEALVTEHLVACVNVIGPVCSIYGWQGQVCRDEEYLLIVKTRRARLEALQARVLALHPYEVPEFLALPVEAGSRAYLDWLRAAAGAPADRT